MAKDPKTQDISDISDIQAIAPDGNKPEGDPPPTEPEFDEASKEQNGNQPSALFVSSNQTTVTILRNRTLRHNGIEYKGGTTLDLPTKDANFLIKHHYAVAGSVLPEGGIIIPKTHIPKAGSDVG